MSLGARGGDPSRLAFLKLVGAGLRIAGEVLLSAAVMHRFMPRGLASASSRPRRPLVLCHGLLGFRSLLDSRWSKTLGLPELHYYRGVVERLRAEGHTVLLPEVGRVDSIAERAQTLRRFVVAAIENPSLWNGVPRAQRKVHLVCHSMGGLDSRYFVSRLGGYRHVATVTTVATPHRGSSFADWALKAVGVGTPLTLQPLLDLGAPAFSNLTTSFCREEFNPLTPDHPDVRYYSFGGAKDPSEMFWALRFSAGIVAAAEGPNDGLVSVNSAQWGKYIGTLRADHVEQVNWHDWSLRSLLSDASEGPSDAVWASTASERAEAAEGLLRSQPADSGSESPTQGSFDALRFYSDLANVLSEL